jgi:hypothetical protein
MLVYARRAGVWRRAFLSGDDCGGASMHAAWMDCSTFPALELAARQKVSTDKVLRQKLERCASLESPLGYPP